MSAAHFEHWDQLASLVQAYAQRKYGVPAVAITIHLLHDQPHREPLVIGGGAAPPPCDHDPPGPVARPVTDWASGELPKALSDCQRVYWPGLGEFRFGEKQAAAMRLLWEAYEDGTHEVAQTVLMAAAGSDGRLHDLFKNHRGKPLGPGRLIVAGAAGNYRFAPLPDPDEEG